VLTTDADGAGRLDVPLDRPVEIDGVAVRYLERRRPRRLFRAPALGAELERRLAEVDVVHLHSVFLDPTRVAARRCERRGTPYVVSPRGILSPALVRQRGALRKRLWIALVERRTLAHARAIVVTSELERADVEAMGLALVPIRIVPNGVGTPGEGEPESASGLARAGAAAAGGDYVLFLGRLAAKKRLEPLIEAVAAVDGLRLLVAGVDDEGLASRIAARARALGIEARVELLGEVHGAAKRLLLERALALVLPSSSENFGNVVLESLWAGRPAIVASGVGAAEVVRAAAAGWVVEEPPGALAAALRALVDDPREADARGARGRAHVLERYGWERIADRMDSIYREAGAG
jgi:glycosyltransferase involved in cell wall biosynthesis